MEKSQLVVVPNPDISHLASTVEFSKLLVNHDDRLSITILIIAAPSDATADSYISSISSSPSVRKRLQLIFLPTDPSPPSQYNHISSFLESIVELSKPHVRDAVSKLTSEPDSPRLAGFIVDMFSTAMIDVADEFGVPSTVFFTSSAASLGLLLHLHTLRERDNVDTTASEFKDSGKDLTMETFTNPVPLSVVPSFAVEEEWKSFFSNYGRGLKRAKGIIVNTFEELESHAIRSVSKNGIRVYPVGPVLGLKADSDNNTVHQKSAIIEWLDNQPPSSVIFLCFGSKGRFHEEQVREIAIALERSGVRFVWSLRKPPPKDPTAAQSGTSCVDFADILPEGFLERTAGIGRVIGWAPQTQILAHEATGGFVSHCGWNSTLESIYFGVPIATWPLYAEQQMNAFEVVRELKMAVEITLDYNMVYDSGTKFVSGEKIEKGIREVMKKEENEVKKKVKRMSEICRKALTEGGSSYNYLGRLIDDITKMELN